MKLGNPPKEFYVQIDTGSDILWVTCNPCNGCPTSSGLNVSSFSDAVFLYLEEDFYCSGMNSFEKVSHFYLPFASVLHDRFNWNHSTQLHHPHHILYLVLIRRVAPSSKVLMQYVLLLQPRGISVVTRSNMVMAVAHLATTCQTQCTLRPFLQMNKFLTLLQRLFLGKALIKV